ncbi:MAG: sodium:solute symporter family protein [Planctomycetota bacterium]|nr:sodium:solute symporter family protein [Planctomycetota bacterium]
MNFYWPIDGTIIFVYLAFTMLAGLAVRKYVGKVEDFLVAGREVNLHLGIASLAATEFGIVTCMYTAQNAFDHGFAGMTPGILMTISMFLVGATGFCIEPMRKAGVMTIPEMFEKRFGMKIRWLSGVVIVVGGLLNMGVFLRTGGEFLVHATGMEENYLELTMTVLLIGVAVYTVLGGMLSVLVTDYLQFIFIALGLLGVTAVVLTNIGWDTLVSTVQTNYGEGGFNPFRREKLGWPWVLFNACVAGAMMLTWQTNIQRILAAKDSKTGRKIYTHTSFFYACRFMLPGLWGIAALYSLGPIIGPESANAMPKFLYGALSSGLIGLLIAAMLAADMSTDSSYMLTWGSVIYNDILAPLRRRQQWSQKFGLLVNRFIIIAIGIFLLVYGLWYELKGGIWEYLRLTATIYLSSITALLIACCYWKRANDWGAYAALATGAVLPLTFLTSQQFEISSNWAETRGLNGDVVGVATFVLTGVAMVVGSLLKPLFVENANVPREES